MNCLAGSDSANSSMVTSTLATSSFSARRPLRTVLVRRARSEILAACAAVEESGAGAPRTEREACCGALDDLQPRRVVNRAGVGLWAGDPERIAGRIEGELLQVRVTADAVRNDQSAGVGERSTERRGVAEVIEIGNDGFTVGVGDLVLVDERPCALGSLRCGQHDEVVEASMGDSSSRMRPFSSPEWISVWVSLGDAAPERTSLLAPGTQLQLVSLTRTPVMVRVPWSANSSEAP